MWQMIKAVGIRLMRHSHGIRLMKSPLLQITWQGGGTWWLRVARYDAINVAVNLKFSQSMPLSIFDLMLLL